MLKALKQRLLPDSRCWCLWNRGSICTHRPGCHRSMDDDWSFSVDELDSMEQSAKRSLAERRGSSSLASAVHTPSSSPMQGRTLPSSIYASPSKKSCRPLTVKLFKDKPGRISLETQYNLVLISALKTIPGHEWDQARRVWTYPEDKLENVYSVISSLSGVDAMIEVLPPLSLSMSHHTGQMSVCVSKSSPTNLLHTSPSSKHVTVTLYFMDTDLIAARNPYYESIKEACQSIPGRSWNVEERVWTFPKASLEQLVEALKRISNPSIKVDALPPLVLPESVRHMNNGFGRSEHEKGVTPRVALWPVKQMDAQAEHARKEPPASMHSVKFFFHNSGNIAAKFDYDPHLVSAIKSVPKAEWHTKERLWLFPFSSLREAENNLTDVDGVKINLENLEPLVRRALDAHMAVPDLRDKYECIPPDLERRLLPFQRDGVRFVLQHGGRALIADEMGLGKTLQAIAVATCFRNDWPVLVITPSALRLHWAAAIQQWLNVPSSEIVVVASQFCTSNRAGFSIMQPSGNRPAKLDGLFNIISYDILSKLQDEITCSEFKIIIADEAHYLKNAQAKRTTACVPLLQRSKYAILLTGTPALSRPIELFKQLEALRPRIYRNVHEYGKRYCMGGHFGTYQGATNCDELHALMKSTIMIRRLKREVLSELPLKRRQQIYLSLEAKGMKQMHTLFCELEAVKRNLQNCKSQEDVDKLKCAENLLITKIYAESAEVKLPAVQDYLSTVLEADCKFLVFAHHKTMLDGIEHFFVKKKVSFIRIDGRIEPSSRQALVQKFQDSDCVKAALLGIRAAGVGLSLTAASTVIFAEMSWTPGDLVQAEDRVHRIGQVSSVNIYYLHAHDTIDDLIWDAVQHKLENISQVLDGKEDNLHVAATGHHYNLPLGQSTLKSFLRPYADTSSHTSENIPHLAAFDDISSSNPSTSWSLLPPSANLLVQPVHEHADKDSDHHVKKRKHSVL